MIDLPPVPPAAQAPANSATKARVTLQRDGGNTRACKEERAQAPMGFALEHVLTDENLITEFICNICQQLVRPPSLLCLDPRRHLAALRHTKWPRQCPLG